MQCIHTFIHTASHHACMCMHACLLHSPKKLLQTVRSHDVLNRLLGHVAHAAKTSSCGSPLLVVLVSQLWLHNIITDHLYTQHFDIQYVRNSVPHNSFTHNSLTYTSPCILGHTTLLRPLLSHVTLSPTAFLHSTLSHPPLWHTTPFTHTSVTNNTFTRNSFLHLTSRCTSCTYRSSTISFLFPASPIPVSPFFGYLLEEVDIWGPWGHPVPSPIETCQLNSVGLSRALQLDELVIHLPSDHCTTTTRFSRLKRAPLIRPNICFTRRSFVLYQIRQRIKHGKTNRI